MGGKTFNEFCDFLYKCAEKLEDEFKKNIIDIDELIIKNETIDVKLPLQKVKLYHYTEIVNIMIEMKVNIKKILYHKESIKKLDSTKKLSVDEVKNYFSFQSKSSEDLTRLEPVTRRQKRRVASEISLYTLSTWETYLKRKEEEELTQTINAKDNINVPKRNQPKSKRKQKKMVSSTFNDILEIENISSDESNGEDIINNTIQEEDTEEYTTEHIFKNGFPQNEIIVDASPTLEKNTFSSTDLENTLNDTKPKIVDVMYKKQKNEISVAMKEELENNKHSDDELKHEIAYQLLNE